MTTSNPIEKMAINAIRVLSIDMVEQANSGHPGMPMGAAPMAYLLWTKFMRHNPDNPKWFNRDRFVLSAGHGSAMLYSLLHLTGYDLPMEELKRFRQWGSRTPGHPEYGHTPGVEATTGPLGQGISMAVGMAMAERHLAAKFNRENFPVVDHYTYVIASDGDLMEGVAAEAASLAGHLKLGKLIVLYDSNDISLDGDLALAFSEDVKKRFESYGWHVLKVEDEDDLDALSAAIREAQAVKDRPTLIEVKTTIGYGSPNKAGTHKVHGAPLGAEEAALVRKAYGWPSDEPFFVPEEVRQHFAEWKEKAKQAEAEWNRLMEAYREAYPELAAELDLAIAGRLPEGWDRDLPVYPADDKGMATRKASGEAINAIAKNVPTLYGGSADLASSNNTTMKEEGIFGAKDYTGRNVWFGVREHGMGAALNGMALHGGVRPYGATFLVFSDYLRPSIRLAALMQLPVTYVFTHDSIAVGEDGPTHEPIEQIPSLRLIPGLKVIRPADANETMAAWRLAMEEQDGPTALILTRQSLPVLEGTAELAKDGVRRGAYVLSEAANGSPQAILIATGSEVSLAVQAQKKLAEKGIHVRVVSMPCRERFEQQPEAYRQSVLPKEVSARVAIEAAHPMGWDRYVGELGAVIGVDRFGASAPGSLVMKEYGFTVDHVIAQVEQLLG
ncbi:transketolase [Polycladomyces subterraneus]|uniref:Transketolase n=1 Tax=Polycladomyces subterraneus TaxID=1016997 RepID=A0ABT8IKV4_9BACL|nr:transketolase [Polycladomyces subterraneus]MDN4593381.1 transketolase [Polycladomyces subterraneus]